MWGIFGKLIRDRRGATAIEYGLIVSLMVIVAIPGFRALGGSNGGSWGSMANKVAAVMP